MFAKDRNVCHNICPQKNANRKIRHKICPQKTQIEIIAIFCGEYFILRFFADIFSGGYFYTCQTQLALSFWLGLVALMKSLSYSPQTDPELKQYKLNIHCFLETAEFYFATWESGVTFSSGMLSLPGGTPHQVYIPREIHVQNMINAGPSSATLVQQSSNITCCG